MDGRFADPEPVPRIIDSLLARLEKARIDSEIADVARKHQAAVRRGDEAEARALSIRELELIRLKKGLATGR